MRPRRSDGPTSPQNPDSPAAFLESWGGYPAGQPPGNVVVEGILLAARRQSARYLVHNLNDLPHDITAVATGGALEQIAKSRREFSALASSAPAKSQSS